jgi:V/A-type H+-transporting ATPase subunit G/H
MGKGGEIMSLDAIKQVTETEQISAQRKLDAEAEAKKAIGEAERAGRAQLQEARAEAQTKVKALMAQAEKGAAKDAEQIGQQTEQSCEQLKAEARAKLEAAATLIVRRVVNV